MSFENIQPGDEVTVRARVKATRSAGQLLVEVGTDIAYVPLSDIATHTPRVLAPGDKVTVQDVAGQGEVVAVNGENVWVDFPSGGLIVRVSKVDRVRLPPVINVPEIEQ